MTSAASTRAVPYRFRQSWINTFLKCPEQARVEMFDPQPRGHTDSTALGTAVHAGIDWACGDMIEFGIQNTLATGRDIVRMALDQMEWKYTKFSRERVYALADQAYCTWDEHVRHLIRPAASEWEFEVPFVTARGTDVILTGTADLVDARGFIIDWKTAGQPYEHWEYQRWAVQPTVYTLALIEKWADGTMQFECEEPSGDFTYHVMLHDGTHQQLDVTRDARHYQWLAVQLDAIVELIEADLERWPLNDAGWHCSPRWCGNWKDCKGASMGPGDSFKI